MQSETYFYPPRFWKEQKTMKEEILEATQPQPGKARQLLSFDFCSSLIISYNEFLTYSSNQDLLCKFLPKIQEIILQEISDKPLNTKVLRTDSENGDRFIQLSGARSDMHVSWACFSALRVLYWNLSKNGVEIYGIIYPINGNFFPYFFFIFIK